MIFGEYDFQGSIKDFYKLISIDEYKDKNKLINLKFTPKNGYRVKELDGITIAMVDNSNHIISDSKPREVSEIIFNAINK